jgi:hypothetical protein
VILQLGPGMPRCVMVDAPPGRQDADPKVLQVLAERHDLLLGLQAQGGAHGNRPGRRLGRAAPSGTVTA